MCAELLSHVRLLATLWTVAHHALIFVGVFRQEYWSELPFPPLGAPLDLGIDPVSPVSFALQMGSLPAEPSGKHPLKWL